jgi:hypothetical protein
MVDTNTVKRRFVAGQILCCRLPNGHPRFGIYMDNGKVTYPEPIRETSIVCRIVNRTVDEFSLNGEVEVDSLRTSQCKNSAQARIENALRVTGKFWGNNYDTDPSHSFVRWVCDNVEPPDGSPNYRYALVGAIAGNYVGPFFGVGGILGAIILGGIGYIAGKP